MTTSDRSAAPDAGPLLLDPRETDVAPEVVAAGHRVVFGRIGRNVGWLLGGRGFAGVVSIAYLAIASRALGPAGFGVFALILAYGGSIANLVQFKSWQAVIRFGAIHLAAHRPERLARLLGFTATLDVAGALLGAAVAAIGVHLAAPLLGWTADERSLAAAFGAMLLLSTGGTASGILRLSDRFDWVTYAEAVGPTVRLVGALAAYRAGAGLDWFLAVWALAALAEGAAGWVAVFVLRLGDLRLGPSAIRDGLRENPGLRAFMVQTNLSSALGLVWEQLGTLSVGAFGGPAAAGAFRIATKLATALAKPVETMTRALYPELARLVASDDRATLRTVTLRVTAIASALALVLVAAIWLAGPLVLRLVAGRAFEFAQLYLLPLTIASAIDLGAVALEPIHNAYGRAGRVLAARVVGALLYLATLALLLPTIGTIGAAIAGIVGAVAIRGLLLGSARRLVRTAQPGRQAANSAR